MPIISDLMGTTLTQSAEKKPGSRTGRPNYPRELRERLAAAACEPGVSVAKLARENGIDANMLFTWRRRYLADRQARSAGLIPVARTVDSGDPRARGPSVCSALFAGHARWIDCDWRTHSHRSSVSTSRRPYVTFARVSMMMGGPVGASP
jgi:hypothetical protein